MKIFDIDSSGHVTLIADSAWRPDRRPYFPVLDGGSAPDCCVRPALRVDRLGKNIAERFAARYLGAWALVAVNNIGDADGMAPWNVVDDAVILGPWQPLPDGPVAVAMAGRSAVWTYDPAAAAALLSRLSAGCTFKTGDIIILPQRLFDFAPRPDLHIEVTAGGTALLDFNIK